MNFVPATAGRLGLVAVLLFAASTSAFAQAQDQGRQKCLNDLGKNSVGVARTQDKENATCLALAAKGADLPGGSVTTCLSADAKSKVAKAQAKTTAAESDSCTPAPDFGFTGAAAANDGAVSSQRSLMTDLFGQDPGSPVALCGTDMPACDCQAAVLKGTHAAATARLKTYLACKKAALKDGAETVSELTACVSNAGTVGSIVADTKGKIAQQDAKLEGVVSEQCLGASLSTSVLFPGDCVAASGAAQFTECVDNRIECRTCEMLNASDSLGVDCDLFDDGLANASCVDFSGYPFFSVGAGAYALVSGPDSVCSAESTFPASAGNYFELQTVPPGGTAVIFSTGAQKYLRADDTDSLLYADAADVASATKWVVFVESAVQTGFFFRDGPASSNVDAMHYDAGTGKLQILNVPIITAITGNDFRFQFGQ